MGVSSQRYKVRYLPVFREDLDAVTSYITNVLCNPTAALRLVDGVERAIALHLENPTMAPVYPSTRERDLPYYWFKVGNYLVFYVVFGDTMEVRRLLYGARNIESCL